MKFGRDRHMPQPVDPAAAAAQAQAVSLAATLEMRVACLQEANKRAGSTDLRHPLVIAKEYEIWCLTGDNLAARQAAEQAQAALTAAPQGKGEK